MNPVQTPEERVLAELLVEALNLEDLSAEQIDPEKALFGDDYGLDSIDALELALAISKRYGVDLKADDEKNWQIFANLRALSAHIEATRASPSADAS